MDFEQSFASSLVVILVAFVYCFRDRINTALVGVAVLLALAVSTLNGSTPPDVNPLTILGSVLWQTAMHLKPT